MCSILSSRLPPPNTANSWNHMPILLPCIERWRWREIGQTLEIFGLDYFLGLSQTLLLYYYNYGKTPARFMLKKLEALEREAGPFIYIVNVACCTRYNMYNLSNTHRSQCVRISYVDIRPNINKQLYLQAFGHGVVDWCGE